MNLFNFPVRRPVTIIMAMFIALILGGIALWKTPLDLMPDITFPNLMTIIEYDGAGPEQIERTVARPLEQVIKTVPNLKNIYSTSGEEICIINTEFTWGTNLDSASADLREKMGMVKKYLPDGVEDPVIMRINMKEMPILFLNLRGEGRHLSELNKIATDQVAPALERIPGVASVTVMGGRKREIQVNLDKNKMVAYGLGITDVINSIRYQNLNLTAGHFEQSGMRIRVKAEGEFNDLEDLSNLVVGNGMTAAQRQQMQLAALAGPAQPLTGQGAVSPIRLRDIAEIQDGFQESLGAVRVIDKTGSHAGVGMAVMKETDANTVIVARKVKALMPQVQKALPKGVQLDISFDLSQFVEDAIGALRSSAVEGGIYAIIVILVFLWQIVPTLIVALSIPLSLLIAMVCMYFSGYTLNIMTLGAMVIAVGKLVDDSIVVVENIYRHLGMGKNPHQAAEDATREVSIAVTAATLVAVIVFLPIAFTQGLSAQLFRSFAATITYALMASLFVSFTVAPMLGSRLLRPRAAEKAEDKSHLRIWGRVQDKYGQLLAWTLDHKGKVLILASLILVMTGMMAYLIPTEFVPNFVGGIYEAKMELPVGSSLSETTKLVGRVEKKMSQFKDVDKMFMIIGQSGDRKRAAFMGQEQGGHQSTIMIKFPKKIEGRVTTDAQLRQAWDELGRELPGSKVGLRQAGGMQFQSTKPIAIKVFGDDFTVLKKLSDEIAAKLKKVEGVKDVTTTMQEGTPELVYALDRTRLSNYGMVTGQAAMALQAAVDGEVASIYRESGDEFDIRVRLQEADRNSPKEISSAPLASPLGFSLPVRDVSHPYFTQGPVNIKRENSKRIVTVEANKTDRPLGLITADIDQLLAGVQKPESYFVEFGGERKDQMEAFEDLAIMFALGVFLIYMVIASLYESLIHPFTIMVPASLFSFTGALIGLYLTHTGFGVTAFIGIIMLIGIVATNSIVFVDFILEYHRQGMDRRQAIIEAGRTRLRPILMTALTTLFGVLPIAMGRAEGMEMQQPLGIVVVGGLCSSTFLTLIIIPSVYEVMDQLAVDLKNLFRRKKPAATPTPSPTPGGGGGGSA